MMPITRPVYGFYKYCIHNKNAITLLLLTEDRSTQKSRIATVAIRRQKQSNLKPEKRHCLTCSRSRGKLTRKLPSQPKVMSNKKGIPKVNTHTKKKVRPKVITSCYVNLTTNLIPDLFLTVKGFQTFLDACIIYHFMSVTYQTSWKEPRRVNSGIETRAMQGCVVC